jgi:predicted DNA-binding transcriptional regulator YafY
MKVLIGELRTSRRTFYRDLDCIISAGFDVRPIRFEDGELRYYLAHSPILPDS